MDAKAEGKARHQSIGRRDHVRGGGDRGAVTLLIYADYLCPYCRRMRRVLERLRQTLGPRMAYVYRHFPNEGAHPGAELLACAAEAAGRQGKFWEMHDALFTREPPLGLAQVLEIAADLGLDLPRFRRDIDSPQVRDHVAQDVAEGRRSGVTGTPTLFIDDERYDGAWDFHALLEALQRPVGAQVRQTARAFANLPASAGIVLLAAAAVALIAANSPLAPVYQQITRAHFSIGLPGAGLTLSGAEWISEALLSVFFLVVGLDLRREVGSGVLASWRTASLPVVAAFGGMLAPAGVYLALNPGPTAAGWSVPTATDIAFALAILAVLGRRAPAALKVFVAAFAVMDDVLSIAILGIFYRTGFHPQFLIVTAGALAALALLNAWRIYAAWPYVLFSVVLWLSLHLTGVQAALSGVLIAIFLPAWPPPAVGPLLAQAATALAELEQAERQAKRSGREGRLQREPIWDWARQNLVAAGNRLLSPADRVERAVSPWASYVILPLFAFSAAGVPLAADFSAPGGHRVFAGVILGLVVGKPLGVALATLAAIRTRLAAPLDGVSSQAFLGAACLCGIGDSFSLLLAEHAFPHQGYADIARIGVLVGSAISALIGAVILLSSPPAKTPAGAKTRKPALATAVRKGSN